jgi:hypothetical protein
VSKFAVAAKEHTEGRIAHGAPHDPPLWHGAPLLIWARINTAHRNLKRSSLQAVGYAGEQGDLQFGYSEDFKTATRKRIVASVLAFLD